ncbi:MAG: hypothetical protein ING08_02490 [Roseomonas sp.]|nr:hypothetical protein [Roseomonas sp.]
MTFEATILDFAKLIAGDLERGKSSREAMEVAGMLAGSGDRRLFWAARCAWMAATLKDSDHRCRAEWRNFALVARDLAGREPLPDNSLLQMIADRTHQTFKANAPKRRQAGRKPR